MDGVFERLLKLAFTARGERFQRIFYFFRFGAEDTSAGGSAAAAFLDIFDGIGVELVIIRQLFARHDACVAGEKCHAWFARYGPLDHPAVWFAGVVDKARDRASGGVQDHLLVEVHQIIALSEICQRDLKG